MSVSHPITQDVLFFFGDKTWELELYENLWNVWRTLCRR